MKIVELTGLPGAGKSTLRDSLNHREYRKLGNRRFRIFVKGKKCDFEHGLLSPKTLLDNTKKSALDAWAWGSLLSYPKLFSEVLGLVELVPVGDRQRAIVLNYWRERARGYTILRNSQSNRVGVADEGFIQTLLTTLIRIPHLTPSDSHAKLAIQRVVSNLPAIDLVVVLRIHPDAIKNRLGSSGHWGLSRTSANWLDAILTEVAGGGIEVGEIDSLGSRQQVRSDFHSLLTERGWLKKQKNDEDASLPYGRFQDQ